MDVPALAVRLATTVRIFFESPITVLGLVDTLSSNSIFRREASFLYSCTASMIVSGRSKGSLNEVSLPISNLVKSCHQSSEEKAKDVEQGILTSRSLMVNSRLFDAECDRLRFSLVSKSSGPLSAISR